MENENNISQYVELTTIPTMEKLIIERIKMRRKEMNLSQRALSEISGVANNTIIRFEKTGAISLNGLMRIAKVMGCLKDFDHLFKIRKP